jgi:anhydro-N-acetylmuramic acid kinase
MPYVIGLMSGTSVDGIDAALVNIQGTERDLSVELLAEDTYPYPAALQERILALCAGAPCSMAELAELDDAIAIAFADAAIALQTKQGLTAALIGSHGQTVFHRPPNEKKLGYSLQLGRGELIAHRTKLTTVSNFRAADIAAEGHGAPLVPKIDVCLLSHPTLMRCVQNLGGIGNVAVLPPLDSVAAPGEGVKGWDTGPANVLIDMAVQRLSQGQQTYDRNGAWAAQGTPCQPLVEQWLQQDFFQQPPPKSTGRELFSPAYLEACLTDAEHYSLNAADILATLTEFTVASVVDSYQRFLDRMPDQVLLGGGGSKNAYLKARLQALLGPTTTVMTTDDAGLNAGAKEAIAFAVLAHWRVNNIPGNLPSATGAKCPMLLGEIHQPVGF